MSQSEVLHRPAGLRIGIDGDAFKLPLAGIGNYVFELCRELDALLPTASFFVYSRMPASRLKFPSHRWTLRTDSNSRLARMPSFLWLRTRGAWLAQQDRLDVFWGGRGILPKLGRSVRTVVSVHDLNHWIVPETMQRSTRWSHWLWFDKSVRRADAVVTNSRGTAERVALLLGRTADAVALPGASPRFRRLAPVEEAEALARLAETGICKPYLLSVATLEPRKNVEMLFRAFLKLKAEGALAPNQQLVLVGVRGWSNLELANELKAASDKGVVVTGYIPDELLPDVYACADALICPSVYEGFGMPVLEARACGTRVIVSNTPELREAGGAHAIVVEPSIADLVRGILEAYSSRDVAFATEDSVNGWLPSAKVMAEVLSGSAASQSP